MVEAVLGFVGAHTFAPAEFTIGQDRTCRLHPELARRLVGELGQIGGISPILAELLRRVGHEPPAALPHRSKAWLTQRGLMR